MGYSLGVDVGTTFTAAAIWRDERVEVVGLESHRVAVPTVIFASGDEMVFGGAAVGRGATEPQGAAREFKRRLGDPVPLVLSGATYSADRLVALFAQWIVDTVSEQIGEPPERIVITHPANWTEFQLHLLTNALQQTDLGDVAMLTEPQAAAVDFGAAAHLEPGQLVVVYDLGGGTFDVALLRREAVGFAHVGEPAGVERLGGIDFDEAVFQHVISNVAADVVAQARSDPAGRMALAQLRRSCVDAKESLSSELAVDIPIVLPGATTTVRLTRGEFEAMIRPMLHQTLELVQQVVTRAGVSAHELSAVLLVGGSSRIPLVSELVREQLDAPVRVDAHPKLVVARGAARWAGALPTPAKVRPPVSAGSRRRLGLFVGAAAVAAGIVGVGAWFVTASDGGDSTATDTTVAPATNASPVTSASTQTTQAPSTTESSPTSTAPPPDENVTAVNLLGSVTFPAEQLVDGRPFGGLSDIEPDPVSGSFIAASDNAQLDERGIDESLLYELEINLGGDARLDEGDVRLGSLRSLLDPDGEPYVRLDGEGVAVGADQTAFLAVEGVGPDAVRPPQLLAFETEGSQISELSMPPWYSPRPRQNTGITEQGGFSALTFVNGASPMIVGGFDYALRQDLASEDPTDDKFVRLITFDPVSGEPMAEYGYPLDPRPARIDNQDQAFMGGLFDLAAIDESGTIIAIEYSLETGSLELRLFEVDLASAEAGTPSSSSPPLLEKRWIADLSALGISETNYQGMGRGPDLADGTRTVILVSDNEFNNETKIVALGLELG